MYHKSAETRQFQRTLLTQSFADLADKKKASWSCSRVSISANFTHCSRNILGPDVITLISHLANALSHDQQYDRTKARDRPWYMLLLNSSEAFFQEKTVSFDLSESLTTKYDGEPWVFHSALNSIKEKLNSSSYGGLGCYDCEMGCVGM